MRSVVLRGPVVLCLLALSGLAVSATLYKWVDAQGVVHYSDTPHAGAEVIQVSGAQTYHNTPVPAASNAAQTPPSTKTTYLSCAITAPAANADMFAPESVDVAVAPNPGLQVGDSVSALMDGQLLQPVGQNGTQFQIPSPERGDHTVTAQIRAADGTVLCTAAAVSFTIQRPSVNSPQSPVKPH